MVSSEMGSHAAGAAGLVVAVDCAIAIGAEPWCGLPSHDDIATDLADLLRAIASRSQWWFR